VAIRQTQVGIIGAGPAGLLLSQILARVGIDAVVLESRSRSHIEARQRAGVLEQSVAQVLRDVGVGDRMDAQGFAHDGIYLQFDGERHSMDLRALTGRGLQVWAQTEVVKDLVAARTAAGLALEFEVSGTVIHDIDTEHPRISYLDADANPQELRSDVVVGCDGFYGPSRATLPENLLTTHERRYPYAWLGILTDTGRSADQVLYANHQDGFALLSMRSPILQRAYLQVSPDDDLDNWPDERIWKALQTRLGLNGWSLEEGPIREKNIAPMRSFVAGPMQHGRLFLAGDAAHTVPPTGAKGMNLAIADVHVLSRALHAYYDRRSTELLDNYTATVLRRVWRAQHFSYWMTSMLHSFPEASEFDRRRQVAELEAVTATASGSRFLAENYVGAPLV
jgi:p-hydroxybenzoate 3-monooxygenase